MALIEIEETIRGSQADVFARAADLGKWPENCSGIKRVEILTEGPVRVGTRFRETREMFGREATEEMEFTRIDPPHGYTVEANSCGTHYRTDFLFQQQGEQTLVKLRFEGTPLTWFSRVMGMLMMPMMKGMMRKCIQQDLSDLKKAIETSKCLVTAKN